MIETKVSLTIDVTTVFSDPVVINEIVIEKPEVTYAIGDNTSNVDEIQKNVNDYAGANGGGSGGDGGSSEGPKLIIEHLYMRNGTVSVTRAVRHRNKPGFRTVTQSLQLDPDKPMHLVLLALEALLNGKQAVLHQHFDITALRSG